MKSEKNRLWKNLMEVWSRETPACQVFLAEGYTRKFPEDFFGWIVFADGLIQISSFKRAADALCIARRISPSEHVDVVYSKIGSYYREMGDPVRAERWYRKAIAASESQEYLVFLGACLAKQGRYVESRYYHQKAAEFDPQKAEEALFNVGLVYRAETEFLEALRCFEKAIEIDPDYHDAKIARDDILQLLEIRSSVTGGVRRKRRLPDH